VTQLSDPKNHPAWLGMLDVYAGAVSGDRMRVDSNISPEATMFDSHSMPLIHGRGELNAVRDDRPAGDPNWDSAATIDAFDPEIYELADGTVLLLHRFVYAAGDERFAVRNTSVWQREGDHWFMVHNHEDVFDDKA
jgi:Domain of unknown function (DUF4440)